MSRSSESILESLLQSSGLAWLVDLYEPREQALPAYLDLLDRIDSEYQARFGESVSFSPQALEAAAQSNRHRTLAFLQLLRPDRTPAMLVMVWRVLQGARIREAQMEYRELNAFRLRFTLADGERTDVYESHNISDAVLLRHLGIAKVQGQPLFDGFYALRLAD